MPQYDFGPGLGEALNSGIHSGFAAYDAERGRVRQDAEDARRAEAYQYGIGQRPAQEEAAQLGLQGARLGIQEKQHQVDRQGIGDEAQDITMREAKTQEQYRTMARMSGIMKAGQLDQAKAEWNKSHPEDQLTSITNNSGKYTFTHADGESGSMTMPEFDKIVEATRGPVDQKGRFEGKDNYVLDSATGAVKPLPAGTAVKGSNSFKEYNELAAMGIPDNQARMIAYSGTIRPVTDELGVTKGFLDVSSNTLMGSLDNGKWVPNPDWLRMNGQAVPAPTDPAALKTGGGIGSYMPDMPTEGAEIGGNPSIGAYLKPGSAGAPAPSVAQPASRADYDKLPSGTQFLDPQGQARIKP